MIKKIKEQVLEELAKKKIIVRNSKELLEILNDIKKGEIIFFDEVGYTPLGKTKEFWFKNLISSKILNDSIDIAIQKTNEWWLSHYKDTPEFYREYLLEKSERIKNE